MKKQLCFLMVLLSLLTAVPAEASGEKPEISAKAAIVLDSETGQILFEKNKDEKAYPASITKVLTVYLSAKNCKKDDLVLGSHTAIDIVPKDSTNIALDYDEQLTVEQAEAAAMLMSANDAANALGEKVSGNLSEFVKLMNTTAQSFGAQNSNFMNTNGLPDENHYTTAYDFAKITREVIKNKTFMDIFTMQSYTVPKTNKKDETRNFVSKHRLMRLSKYSYLGVMGGKTGYTTQAKHTMVSFAEREGRAFVAVVLGSESLGALNTDMAEILDYAFTGYTPITVTAEEIGEHVDGKLHKKAVGKASFYLPVAYKKADLKYTFNDDKVLITEKNGNLLATLNTERFEVKSKGEKIWGVVWRCLLILLAAVILLFLFAAFSANRRKKKRLQKRRLQEIKNRTGKL